MFEVSDRVGVSLWTQEVWNLLGIIIGVSFLESDFMHSCLFIHCHYTYVTAVVSEKVMYFVIRPPTLYASNTIMNSLASFTGIGVCGTNDICCWFHGQLCRHDMIMPPLYFTDNNYLKFISNLPFQVFNASIFCC